MTIIDHSENERVKEIKKNVDNTLLRQGLDTLLGPEKKKDGKDDSGPPPRPRKRPRNTHAVEETPKSGRSSASGSEGPGLAPRVDWSSPSGGTFTSEDLVPVISIEESQSQSSPS